MHFTKKTNNEKRSDLVKLLKSNKLLRFPGAYNPLCAKVISEIGFDGVYISGGVMSNDLGIPDIGLTTLNKVSYRSEQLAKNVFLDTSRGCALSATETRCSIKMAQAEVSRIEANVKDTIAEWEKAGKNLRQNPVIKLERNLWKDFMNKPRAMENTVEAMKNQCKK